MLTEPHQSLGFLAHDVARQFRQRFDEEARSLGVTRQQWRALIHLARVEGQTQTELADRLEVERITLCRMIDRLAEAGLVERRADPADRRVWRLHLMPAAHAMVDRLAEIGRGVEAEATAILSLAERAELHRLLGRVLQGMRRSGDDDGEDAA